MEKLFAAQEAVQGPAPMSGWLIMLCMMAGMWFLMIVPQRKRQKQHKAMLDSLKKGDRVMTASGLYGVVSKLGETSLTLEVAQGVHIEMARQFVQARAS